MANSKRKCKHCKEYTAAESGVSLSSGFFCSIVHAAEWAVAKSRGDAQKKLKVKHREDLKRVRRNPRAEALKAAQLLARISSADDNGYCRCVTCGHTGLYNEYFDGGHFIAKGSSSYWMLDHRNIHPQCKSCNGNGMKFGNKEAVYALWMIDNYGREFVDNMQATASTIIKRSTADYDEFIAKANIEIAQHKKRISINR